MVGGARDRGTLDGAIDIHLGIVAAWPDILLGKRFCEVVLPLALAILPLDGSLRR